MIEVKNLVKHFGSKKAVDDISFTVHDNEVLGFLGSNGAGKSTVMNMLTGYTSMTSGEIKICGIDILENPIEAKRQIGYLPEQPPLYPEMTVKEYLCFAAELKRIKDIKKEVQSAAEKVGLCEVMSRRIGNLSKGYKQRTGFAAALLGNPKVLILDEPTVGLDPKQIKEMRNLIRKSGMSCSIIISSHILSEIKEVSDRILILNNGRIVAEDIPERLAAAADNDVTHIVMCVDGTDEKISAVFDGIDGLTYERLSGEGEYAVNITGEAREAKKKLFFAFARVELPILEQREDERSIEEVFIELTKDGGRRDESDI